MPLAVGKIALQSELYSMYTDVQQYKSVQEFARRKAQAIANFVITGIPMTVLSSEPGVVKGAVTQTEVKGTGLGGFDQPVPGMGLASARGILESELISIWTHGGANISAAIYAERMATAIYNYYSQAIIQTKDSTGVPLAAPPPVGPVTGPTTGSGGTLTDSYGSGYATAKPILEAEFIRIWSQIDNVNVHTIVQFAKEMADAIHNFCIQGKVDTTGVILAVAVVGVPPTFPPDGTYLAGTGSATGVVY